MAWDDSGERLAVGLSSGKLALLAAECSPLPSAKFIGWIEGTNGHASGVITSPCWNICKHAVTERAARAHLKCFKAEYYCLLQLPLLP